MSTVKNQPRPAAGMTHAVPSKKPENEKTVGKTYGARMGCSQTQTANNLNTHNSRFLSDKDKQKAVETFGGANDRFQKGFNNQGAAVKRVDMIQTGLNQLLADSHSRPDDDSLSHFLDEIISNPVLQNQRTLRNHLLTRK